MCRAPGVFDAGSNAASREFFAQVKSGRFALVISAVAAPRAFESGGVREVKEQRWSFALETALQTIKKSRVDIDGDRKSAPWRLAVAAGLKRHPDASNRWLATNLNLGTPAGFGHNLTFSVGWTAMKILGRSRKIRDPRHDPVDWLSPLQLEFLPPLTLQHFKPVL